MPVTAIEAHQSRKIGADFREYTYVVTGTDDEVAAQNAVAAQRPQYLAIPNPNRLNASDQAVITLHQKVTAEQEIDGSDMGKHTWRAVMRYEPVEKESEDDDDDYNNGGGGSSSLDPLNYSISITTNTANVKVALEQSKTIASGETDPGDFGNWIGVVRNGSGFDIQGVDCIFPQATLEIERRYRLSQWNAKVRQIIRKVGAVNSGGFEGFGAEEALFAGARVQKTKSYITVNYQFLINQTDDVNIPGVGNIRKKGWRYIWVYSRINEETGIGTKAVAVYVARVYKSVDFGDILR